MRVHLELPSAEAVFEHAEAFRGSEPALSLALTRRGYSARLAWTPRRRTGHLRGWSELLAAAWSKRQADKFRRGSAWQPLRFAAIGTQSGPRLRG
jgi:hypothetical protein